MREGSALWIAKGDEREKGGDKMQGMCLIHAFQ